MEAAKYKIAVAKSVITLIELGYIVTDHLIAILDDGITVTTIDMSQHNIYFYSKLLDFVNAYKLNIRTKKALIAIDLLETLIRYENVSRETI